MKLCMTWIGACVLAVVALPGAAQEVPAKTAHDVVRDATTSVLELIDSSRSWAKEDPERFFIDVEKVLSPAIDFDGFARSVMAVNFKKATEDQRQRFAESFKWSLVRTYALALTEFSDGEVTVLDPGQGPSNVNRESVKQEIRTSTGDLYTVIYSMGLAEDGIWRVRNLIIQGVNLGLAFRSQFASAVADHRYAGDLDKVIDAWANNIGPKSEEAL